MANRSNTAITDISHLYAKTHAAGSAVRRKYALKARIGAQRTEADTAAKS